MGFRKIEDFIQEADLKKNPAQGKSKSKRKSYLAVYLTEEEKEKVNRYAREQGVSVSTFVRFLLKKEGVL